MRGVGSGLHPFLIFCLAQAFGSLALGRKQVSPGRAEVTGCAEVRNLFAHKGAVDKCE